VSKSKSIAYHHVVGKRVIWKLLTKEKMISRINRKGNWMFSRMLPEQKSAFFGGFLIAVPSRPRKDCRPQGARAGQASRRG